MTKSRTTQIEFIKKRALGKSFDKISKELKVHRNTLLQWNREFEGQISNLENIELESLYDQYKMTAIHRIEYIGEIQEKLLKELYKRDLKDIKTDRLLMMIIQTSDKLDELKKKQLIIRTDEEIKNRPHLITKFPGIL